jgi:hypothetical protein
MNLAKSLTSSAVLVLLLSGNSVEARHHRRGHGGETISSSMRNIASREPQIAVLQDKLNKMQHLKPALDGARKDIDEMFRVPITPRVQ